MTALPLFDPPAVIERAAEFSSEKPNPLFRWTLTRRWKPGSIVLYAGLNPSLAGGEKEDPTSQRWIHFGNSWRHSAYIAVNAIPKISPDPLLARDWYWVTESKARDAIFDRNHEYILAAAKQAERVVVCWGNASWLPRTLFERMHETFKAAGHKELWCFGKTGNGNPIHPMARGRHRLPDSTQPSVWRSL